MLIWLYSNAWYEGITLTRARIHWHGVYMAPCGGRQPLPILRSKKIRSHASANLADARLRSLAVPGFWAILKLVFIAL